MRERTEEAEDEGEKEEDYSHSSNIYNNTNKNNIYKKQGQFHTKKNSEKRMI